MGIAVGFVEVSQNIRNAIKFDYNLSIEVMNFEKLTQAHVNLKCVIFLYDMYSLLSVPLLGCYNKWVSNSMTLLSRSRLYFIEFTVLFCVMNNNARRILHAMDESLQQLFNQITNKNPQQCATKQKQNL